MFKRLMMICAVALAAVGAQGATNVPPESIEGSEPTVSDIVAKQRYPWNGLVDITCKVSGIVGVTNNLKFAFAAVMPDSGNVRKVRNFWVVQNGTNSIDHTVYTNGNYRLLWNAEADLGVVNYSNMVVRISFVAHDKVQLWEGGPYWATTNIGAEEPWEFGYDFWWGDTVGYELKNGKWVASDGSSTNYDFSNTPTYGETIETLLSEGWIISKDNTYVLAPEHDAAQVQWGGGWRMPTKQEFSYLANKCVWTWTTTNGVTGYVVSGKGDYASNSIFFPRVGDDGFDDGDCWSSVPVGMTWNYIGSPSYALVLGPTYHDTGSQDRDYGLHVRPVQGFTK